MIRRTKGSHPFFPSVQNLYRSLSERSQSSWLLTCCQRLWISENVHRSLSRNHDHPWWQRRWTSDDCVYPKPLGSGGGVAKHLKLHVSVLVLIRQELVLKLLYETSMSSSCKFSIESWVVKLLIFNVLVISIPVSGKTWTSSGNLGAPNPRGTSGFASSGLIFTRSRYHSIASMSGNTPVMDDDDSITNMYEV